MLLGQTFEVEVLEVVQVAGQAERLKELLLLRPIQLVCICAICLVSVLLRCMDIVIDIGANRHLMAPHARVVIRFGLFEARLIALACMINVIILACRRLMSSRVRLTKGELLVARQIESLSTSKVGASVHISLRHLLLLLGSVFGRVESLAALLICGPGRHCTVHPAAIICVLLQWHEIRVPYASLLLSA